MVTIVPWYPSTAMPYPDTILTHVPDDQPEHLWDGSDATYVDFAQGGASTPGFEADSFAPVAPIPAGRPMWARFHVRVSVTEATDSAVWGVRVTGGGFGTGLPGRSVYPDGSYTPFGDGDGIVSGTVTVHRLSKGGDDTASDRYSWGDELDAFGRDYAGLVRLQYADLFGWEGRFYELWAEVAYEGTPEWPLRQIQRDDHLAPGGTIRASTGTSRQGSIRARGYE